jgi:hypothetical protein
MVPLSRNSRQVAGIVAALTVPGLKWFGEPVVRLPTKLRVKLTTEAAQKLTTQVLERLLYSQFYVLGGAQPFRRAPYTIDTGIDEQAFKSEVIAANASNYYLDMGWKIVGKTGARFVIEQDGLRVSVDREWLRDANGKFTTKAEIGAIVSVSRAATLPRLSPGYLMVIGGRPLKSRDLLRFYWNIVPRAAPLLMKVVPEALHAVGIPFNLKTLNSPKQYARADAAVLYLRQGDACEAVDALRQCYRRLSAFMDPDIPAMTWPIAKGLGAAEDPGTGESFGMSRCRLIAEGLMEAHASGVTSDALRIEAVRRKFEAERLSLERAHLRAGSQGHWCSLNANWTNSPRRRRRADTADPGHLAEAILSGIASRAVWHDGQCTWMGAPNEQAENGSVRRVVPLDGSHYGGTAGISLVLSEMAATGGSRQMKTTALGALRHAVRNVVRAESGVSPLSAYTGAIGTAWVAACIARLLESEEAEAAARALLDDIVAAPRRDSEVDVLVGVGGGAMALASLCRLGHRDRARPLLEECVSQILAAARPQSAGIAWPTPSEPRRQPLTGFSHGAAGIAASLAIAYAELGEECCLEAAFAAVNYEQSFFDASYRNWPDFRLSRGGVGREYSAFWCHGAPGIALSRLILAEVTGRKEFRVQASRALETTVDAIRADMRLPGASHCLCHGLPGNLLILHSAIARIEGSRQEAWRTILASGLESLAADYAPRAPTLPRNPADAGTPALFLGEAGLAYCLLAMTSGVRSRVLELHE